MMMIAARLYRYFPYGELSNKNRIITITIAIIITYIYSGWPRKFYKLLGS